MRFQVGYPRISGAGWGWGHSNRMQVSCGLPETPVRCRQLGWVGTLCPDPLNILRPGLWGHLVSSCLCQGKAPWAGCRGWGGPQAGPPLCAESCPGKRKPPCWRCGWGESLHPPGSCIQVVPATSGRGARSWVPGAEAAGRSRWRGSSGERWAAGPVTVRCGARPASGPWGGVEPERLSRAAGLSGKECSAASHALGAGEV